MIDKKTINTKKYWDDRFSVDWEEKDGRGQSRFFMNLVVENLPEWFISIVKSKKLNICDWGCAFGDGTQLLKNLFPRNEIIGVDFSDVAVKDANLKFPNIKFLCKDYVADLKNKDTYDVVLSSNTLEHFIDSWGIFDILGKKSKQFIVLLLPFEEKKLHKEHVSSFEFPTTPFLRKGWILIHSNTIDASLIPNTQWYGKQILLIYVKEELAQNLDISIGDVVLHTKDNNPSLISIAENDFKKMINDLKISEEKLENFRLENQKLVNDMIFLRNREDKFEIEKEALLNKIEYLESSLNKVIFSKRWILISRFFDIVNKIFPSGSLQRSILKFFAQIVKSFLYLLGDFRKSLSEIKENFISYSIVLKENLFDPSYYVKNELKEFVVFPFIHYQLIGYKKGFEPNGNFDSKYYRFLYPESFKVNKSTLIHFCRNQEKQKDVVVKLPKYLKERFDPIKETLAFQLESFDKGGLEEVVLSLATDEKICEKYNVVVLVAGSVVGHIAELAEKRGIPVFILNHQEDALVYLIEKLNIKICHFHYSVFGASVFKGYSVKTVYTVHNNYIWGNNLFVEDRIQKYKYIDFFVAVSKQVGKYFKKRFCIPDQKLRVIPNGVNIESINLVSEVKREDFGLEKNDFVFINVASFTANKFHPLMIVAMKEVVKENPNAKLLFIGNVLEKNYFDNIKNLINKYGLEKNVKIIDYVPKQQLMGLLKISDCFVLPSLTEGFSISTIEAMYSGLPLILSDIGGAREAIENNDIGIIINNPYKDILELNLEDVQLKYSNDENLYNLQELIQAMSDMYKNSGDWKNKAKKGILKVKENFSLNRVSNEYLQVYKDLENYKSEENNVVQEKTLNINYPYEKNLFIENPLVSIMLPVFNHANLVVDSIESVRAQTYNNWELVILDDGSSDNLLSILERYKDDNRIRIYKQENQKLPKTLSHLHKLVNGEFLTWTSADNIMEEKMVETLTKFLLQNPECVLCYADVSLIDENGDYYNKKNYCDNLRDTSRPYILRLPRNAESLGAEAKNFINACFLYRKKASDVLGGEYAADLIGLEDYDYWLRLSRLGKIMHVGNNDPLYRYRVHKKSMSEELLTIKNEEHMARLEKFINFEKERQQVANEKWNIRISKDLNIKEFSIDRKASKTLYILSKEEESEKGDNSFSVVYDNDYYYVPNKKFNCEHKFTSGFDINPLSFKTRYNKDLYQKRKYLNLNGRPVIGIHFDSSNIDADQMRSVIDRNKNLYFVICDENSNESGSDLVKGFDNACYLGIQEFGAVYEIYSSWDAIMVPPLKNLNGKNLDAQKVLSWSCNKPLFVPKVFSEKESFPMVSYYQEDSVFSVHDLLKKYFLNEEILDKYIQFYSREGRLKYLTNIVNAIIQESFLERPHFADELLPDSQPIPVKE
jgi:glycosyltransferase involved in cell wall biosynthesis